MATLNETPSANRLHIGIYGKTNSGKSSLINALTNQEVSIVADVEGTTTDPVYKPMEIHPLGACVLIDTAGFDDTSELGTRRVEKTKLAAEKTDIAVIVLSAEEAVTCADEQGQIQDELKWYSFFREKHTPVLFVINKADDLRGSKRRCSHHQCKKTHRDRGVQNNTDPSYAGKFWRGIHYRKSGGRG